MLADPSIQSDGPSKDSLNNSSSFNNGHRVSVARTGLFGTPRRPIVPDATAAGDPTPRNWDETR